jgi:septum formation protein
MKLTAPLWLASSSPRRKQMLLDAGLDVRVRPPDIDDGLLPPAVDSAHFSPARWVTALAYLKARRVADELREVGDRFALWHGAQPFGAKGTVLGADTVCVVDGRILGQPRDSSHAVAMLNSMRNRTHQTITGVCLIALPSGSRLLFADETHVHVGRLTDRQISDYVNSGEWKGKAGGYNLTERQAAGWSIETEGDPGTVMGLPMRRLMALFSSSEARAGV